LKFDGASDQLNFDEVSLNIESREYPSETPADAAPSGAGEEHFRGDRDSPSPRPGVFTQSWLIVASLLLIAAAVLLWYSKPEAAFVTAALGVSAWFLNMRGNLKRKYDSKSRG
jgi:hypothetical protein